MAGIEAPWVGSTPEEYNDETEYNFTVTLKAAISVYGKDLYDALEKVEEMSNLELLDYIKEKEIAQE